MFLAGLGTEKNKRLWSMRPKITLQLKAQWTFYLVNQTKTTNICFNKLIKHFLKSKLTI